MAYEIKEGQGSMFVNKDKQSENQPDFRGRILYKGETVEIAGWRKTSQSGMVYISLQAREYHAPSQPVQPATFPEQAIMDHPAVQAIQTKFKAEPVPPQPQKADDELDLPF